MELKGSHRIPAPREAVWQKLNDANTLRECIPGCHELEGNTEDGFAATVRVAIGPVKAKFSGEVTISDLNPPESYRINGQGKGGVAGFASGGASVRLSEVEGETVLNYEVEAKVGGKLAQMGSRLINSSAAKLSDQFFSNFAQQFAD